MSLDDATEARILQKVEYVDEATTVLARKQALSDPSTSTTAGSDHCNGPRAPHL